MNEEYMLECYVEKEDDYDAAEGALAYMLGSNWCYSPSIQKKDDGHHVVTCGFKTENGRRATIKVLTRRFGTRLSFR